MKRDNEPLCHDFKAAAHFKHYTQTWDPFYIYKLSYGTNGNERNYFVFKTIKLKAKFALNMDQKGEHPLSKEFCYFDGKLKHCKGFVTLTASVYHPVLPKLIPLANI